MKILRLSPNVLEFLHYIFIGFVYAVLMILFLGYISFINVLSVQAAPSVSDVILLPEREQIYDWFEQETWKYLDEDTKQSICLFFVNDLSKELNIKTPDVLFEDFEDDSILSRTNLAKRQIILNSDNLFAGYDMIDVCAYEVRHVWQEAQLQAKSDYDKIFQSDVVDYTPYHNKFILEDKRSLETDAVSYALSISKQFEEH